ncbi:MAG: 30S ribosomal protein S3 [Planctomycetota bacterium]|jgi:small subunit ribosomal protein S3
MGQKVSPIGFRTGVTIGWKSRWFAPKSNFGEFLVEDEKIRRFVDQRLNRQPPYAAISAVEIERTREEVKVSLKTARPGLVIGPKGAEVDKLRSALEDLTDRRVSINIVEVRNPDLDAQLTAESIAEQLKRRGSFRRILKQRADSAMQAGAKGIKIMVGGRLGGNEIARSETKILGSIPLHTLEADVDYGFAPSHTTYGTIGVKVWIYRGMFGESVSETDAPVGGPTTRPRRRRMGGESGPGGRGGPGRRSRSGAAPSRRGPAPAEAPEAAAPAPAAPAEPPAPQEGDSAETKES